MLLKCSLLLLLCVTQCNALVNDNEKIICNNIDQRLPCDTNELITTTSDGKYCLNYM